MPPQEANATIVILWEDELRVAAKALHVMQAVSDDEASTKEQVHKAVADALDACWAALYHAGLLDDTSAVTIATKRLFRVKTASPPRPTDEV